MYNTSKRRAGYNERSYFVSADDTHEYDDGNLVRPFWRHAKIEEKDA